MYVLVSVKMAPYTRLMLTQDSQKKYGSAQEKCGEILAESHSAVDSVAQYPAGKTGSPLIPAGQQGSGLTYCVKYGLCLGL